jgi:branched-chain amino acid aminotransferase
LPQKIAKALPQNIFNFQSNRNAMVNSASLSVQRVSKSRISEVDFKNLEFGKYIADHMAMAVYQEGRWHQTSIVPYSNLPMSPAMLALHYGQAIFEGMKAFKMHDGSINIFRPHKHHQRLQKSLARMCMPDISENMFMDALHTLVDVDRAWVPDADGSSLYIRPVVFASEARLGVKVADQYLFVIMNTPVGAYLNKPYRLKVEDHYVRTAEGGTGFAKCAGNYGGAFYPTQLAKQQGYDQVLWTDHKEHKYIDEVGMMNVMFVMEDKLVTPELTSAILDGVTRDSILTLAKEMGMPTVERKISVDELAEGLKSGKITEIFGAGTAAVVAPIALINIHGEDIAIQPANENSFQHKVKKKLLDIRTGHAPDPYGWNYIIR